MAARANQPVRIREAPGRLPAGCGTISITESTSDYIDEYAGTAHCGNSYGGHESTSYLRVFHLDSFPVAGGGMHVCGVQFGVESAISDLGEQPMVVNLYTGGELFPGGFPQSMSPIGSHAFGLIDQTRSLVTVPVDGVAPVGSDLVVEVFAPGGYQNMDDFRIGANGLSESAPSYVYAPTCDIDPPTSTTDLGDQFSHFVMTVYGMPAGPVPPTVEKSFTPETIGAGGSSTLTITLTNVGDTDSTLTSDLIDALPADVFVAVVPNASTSCPDGAVIADPGSTGVTLTSGARIPATSSCTIVADVTSSALGAHLNTIAAGAVQTDAGSNASPANATLEVFTGTFPPDETFDEVAAPTLPDGWISAASGAGAQWTTTTDHADTNPNAVMAPDVSEVADMTLDSPAFTPMPGQTVSFAHLDRFEFQSVLPTLGYDGGVLEISIDGAPFEDILSAGGRFLAGGYDSVISTAYSSPIAGRLAWAGSHAGFTNTTAKLPEAAVGHPTRLRFRTADDASNGSTGAFGWWIDTITLGTDDSMFCGGFDGAGGDGGCGADRATVYDDRATFLQHVAGGGFENTFDDVLAGESDPLDYGADGFVYEIGTPAGAAGGLYNDAGAVSTQLADDAIEIRFEGTPVTAIGFSAWASDADFIATGTTISITLDDGTVETYTSTGPTDFRGFVATVPITRVEIDAPDDAGLAWSTLDDLVVGTTN